VDLEVEVSEVAAAVSEVAVSEVVVLEELRLVVLVDLAALLLSLLPTVKLMILPTPETASLVIVAIIQQEPPASRSQFSAQPITPKMEHA
jgi:hypothetical protein